MNKQDKETINQTQQQTKHTDTQNKQANKKQN